MNTGFVCARRVLEGDVVPAPVGRRHRITVALDRVTVIFALLSARRSQSRHRIAVVHERATLIFSLSSSLLTQSALSKSGVACGSADATSPLRLLPLRIADPIALVSYYSFIVALSCCSTLRSGWRRHPSCSLCSSDAYNSPLTSCTRDRHRLASAALELNNESNSRKLG